MRLCKVIALVKALHPSYLNRAAIFLQGKQNRIDPFSLEVASLR